MSDKRYCAVSATIFLLIGVAHVARLAEGFTFQIGSWNLPRGISALGAIIALSLAWWGFTSARTRSA